MTELDHIGGPRRPCPGRGPMPVGAGDGRRGMSHERWSGDEAEGGPEFDDRLPDAAGELYDDPDLGDDRIPDEDAS